MPKGINSWPVVDVFVGMIADIPFELYNSGAPWDATSTTLQITATFNNEVKFTKALTIVDGPAGLVLLPAEDLFDVKGDWESIIEIADGGQVYFTEQLIFNVQLPPGAGS